MNYCSKSAYKALRFFYLSINFLLTSYFLSAETLLVVPNEEGGIAAIQKEEGRYLHNAKTYFLQFLWNAQHSIDLTMYQLDDEDIINALISAKKRGVNVRLITETSNTYKHDNNAGAEKNKLSAASELSKVGVETKGLPVYLLERAPKQAQVHYKLLMIDGKTAVLMSCNLDRSTLKETRDFGLIFEESHIVKILKKIFEADWQGTPLNENILDDESPLYIDALALPKIVLGPEANQREIFLTLCKNAKKSIRIYNQSFNDEKFVSSLCELLVKRKLKAELVMLEYPFSKEKNANFAYQKAFQKAGGKVYFNDELYIHAKTIIIDERYAYIGSCNIYEPSFLFNRELGWITENEQVIQKLIVLFERDKKHSHVMTF